MFNKVKRGYELFIRKTEENSLIGSVTLKNKKGELVDIDPVEDSEMEFLDQYPSILDAIGEEYAFFMLYQIEEDQFFVSMKRKDITGLYQNEVIWNHDIVSKNKDLSVALNSLTEKVQNKKERSFSK